ncbi:hypothetical protein [Deinococcus cellulosilyticus]|uniref:hypothetical protein n=1 Tax=Deinococcus cellulosilyticus TaxID=401558 RepID=UPI0011BF368A|nr:hypothetical protein [Deinococcus cellulosilyticus]
MLRKVQDHLQIMEVRPDVGGWLLLSSLRKFPSLEAFKTLPSEQGPPLEPGTLVTTPEGKTGVVGGTCEGGFQVLEVDFTREHWMPAHLVPSTSPRPLLSCPET